MNAVHRFRRWCVSIRDVRAGTIENSLPPIDVVMVWHAYLLNPMYVHESVCFGCLLIFSVSWYAEDTMRVPTLSSLPQYTEYLTVHLASSRGHSRCSSLIELLQESPELLTNWPHPDRAQFWRDRTMTPYDPFDSASALTDVTLQCPHCELWTAVRECLCFASSCVAAL